MKDTPSKLNFLLRIISRDVLLVCWVLLLGASFLRACVAQQNEPPRVGIVTTQPTSGTYVEHEGVFLVPFSQHIPGSNVAFTMIPVPGGEFTFGSPKSESERKADEGPQRTITLPPFWIGKCEVTWAEYRNYMQLCSVFERFDDRGIRQIVDDNRIDAITAPSKLYEPSFTFAAGDDMELPAVTMSQYAAKQYTKWLSLLINDFYRLPSEAEWEYACRAGTNSMYSFGSDSEKLGEYAWYADNADDATQQVGQKKPNPWGLHDMHGNACEWVLDAYSEDGYSQLPNEGATSLDAIQWPTKLYPRVLRGGSCLLDAAQCRSASRRASDDDELRAYDPNTPTSPWWFASEESQDIGFRIVRPLDMPAKAEQNKFWESDVSVIKRVADFRIDDEGRGERGIVDPGLPAAINAINKQQ